MEEKLSRLLRRGQSLESEAEGLLKMSRQTDCDGLIALNREEALELAQTHRDALDACGRIEIGTDTVKKLALEFRHSAYLDPQNYAHVLAEATEAFYALKNESEDTISDDELAAMLADGYERFGGNLSAYLGSTELDSLLRARRCGMDVPLEEENMEEKDEEDDPDE